MSGGDSVGPVRLSGAASALIDMSAGFSGRGARRVSNEARAIENGREMSVMQLAPANLGDGTGRLHLEVERHPGVLSMAGIDARGLGDDAQLSIADADLLQVSGKAQIELDGVATAVMDRAAQTVTVSSSVGSDPVALFAGGGQDQITLSGLTGRTRVDLGAGRDVIVSTGYSADEVFGGFGDDEIHSGRGRDVIRAGRGGRCRLWRRRGRHHVQRRRRRSVRRRGRGRLARRRQE